MQANQPQWPREWLMTDERMGRALWEAVGILPAGTGIIFRHYATPAGERAELASRIARLCGERGLILSIARDVGLATKFGAQLIHNPVGYPGQLSVSRSAHSLEQAREAWQAGAGLIFVSPIFPTASHPAVAHLGHRKAVEIARSCPIPAIALGGVTRANFAPLERDGFYGWAGIDAWLSEIRT